MQSEVPDDIRNIFNMPSKDEAEALIKRTIDTYKSKSSELAQWLENDLPEGFTVFSVAKSSPGNDSDSENLQRNC